MPPRLTFVASASTSATRAAAFPLDEGLDDRGRSDASAMASAVKNASAVLASPARRALETVGAFGLEPEIDPLLRDIDVGRWAGQSVGNLAETEAEALSAWMTDPAALPHGGETIDRLCERVSVWLRTMSEREGRVLVVTHPAVIRAAILAAIHATSTSYWYIDIAPLAVVELTSNGRRWALKSITSGRQNGRTS
jgi:broad specificity phosphatase PhoE